MALIPAPDCPIRSASLIPWRPGQSVLQHVSGRVTVVSRGTSGWRGQFVFAPGGPGLTAVRRAKSLAAWAWMMADRSNESDILLPQQFRPASAPDGLSATFTSFSRGGTTGTLAVAVTPSSHVVRAGDFATVANRLYLVQAASGGTLTVVPNTAPTGASPGDAVKLARPTVRVRLTVPPSVGRDGFDFSETTIEWEEAV